MGLAAARTKTDSTPISFVHETKDGPVHLLVKESDKGWEALHWGRKVAGRWTLNTMAQANQCVLRVFGELYGGHQCSAACRPVETVASHKSDDRWGMIRE
jgi:hypothetical protein